MKELYLGDVVLQALTIKNQYDGNGTGMLTSMKMDSSIIDAHDEETWGQNKIKPRESIWYGVTF